MRRRRRTSWAEKSAALGVITTAVLIMAFILIPTSFWRQPTTDQHYAGFDPNLIYSDARGKGTSTGVIEMTADALRLRSVPGSDPTVQLVTTPLSFNVSMRLQIVDIQGNATPFRICLWNSVTQYRACVSLGPSPANTVVLETSSPMATISDSVLGNYVPGQQYQFDANLDKRSNVFAGRLTSDDLPPFSGNMLRLGGGRNSPQLYGDVASDPVTVKPGGSYTFGGVVRALAGLDTYKLNVVWLDKRKAFLGVSNDWQPVARLSGWTKVQFAGLAPPKAAFAELHLAAGDATQVLFAQLFLRDLAGTNSLTNPDFTQSSTSWRFPDDSQRTLDILSRPTKRYRSWFVYRMCRPYLHTSETTWSFRLLLKAAIARPSSGTTP